MSYKAYLVEEFNCLYRTLSLVSALNHTDPALPCRHGLYDFVAKHVNPTDIPGLCHVYSLLRTDVDCGNL